MTKKLLFAHLFTLLISAFCFGQNVEVSGQITEEGTNNPIARVTVTQKGTKNATTTNENGFFSIRVPIGSTLTFSSVGFATKEVEVTGTTINTSLVNQSQDLSAVVVTALGIRKEKKALAYSVSEVKGDELTQARSTNIANQLVGKVAGLNISQTATGPGGSSRIVIRGSASISGGQQPLIVVDGIPIDNSNLGAAGMWGGSDKGDGISSLNPDEIESMTVLKGGTAAALYGSRATMGAILVTTKGGGKSRGIGVEVNSNYVIEDLLLPRMKDYQYEYGTGDNGLKPTSADPNLNQTNSFGAKLDGSSVIQYDGISRPYVAQKNNLRDFYNVGSTFTNSVAFGGATEKIAYRFSLSNMDNKAIVPNSDMKRQNFAINLNGNLSKRLSFLANAKYIREKAKNRPRLSDSPGNANYTLITMPTSLAVSTFRESKYTAQGYERVWSNNQYVQNPYFATEDFIQEDTKNRYIVSFEPQYKITDWLYVKGRAGFDQYTYRNMEVTPTGTGFSIGGSMSTGLRDFVETNLDLMVGLNKDITNKISINALVGGNMMKNVIKSESISGGPFNIPFFYHISNVNPASRGVGQGYFERRMSSVYGSADISYDNYLYLTLTGRNDWFSTLAPDRNNIFYPSVGLSFILSEAFNLHPSINYAKVRASWAQTGGDNVTPYNLSLAYGLSGAHLNAPLAQISNSTVPNALLQPYVATMYEVGLEGRFFNNRMMVDMAVYSRNTTKDIVAAGISGTSGYNSAFFNVGEIKNTGVEALIGYKVGSRNALLWDVSLNFTYNNNKVISLYKDNKYLQLDEPRSRAAYIFQEVGKPAAQIRAIPFLRDANGQIVYNAQGLPKAGPLKSFGTGVSPLFAGITNTFTYNRLSFSFLIDGKFGGKIYSGTNALAYRYGLHKETLPGRETGVVGVGVDETGKPNNVNVPAQSYYTNLYAIGEPFIYSSDFVKLRQIILDYSIPVKWLGGSKSPFQSASIGIVGRNLLIIYKAVPNIDPESVYNNTNAQGLEFAGFPPTRSIGVNLNLKF